jgi:hypothetical protein
MKLLLAIALIACAPRVVVAPQRCESRIVKPAMLCLAALQFDGCRWRCTDEPIEQGPMVLTVGGFEAR